MREYWMYFPFSYRSTGTKDQLLSRSRFVQGFLREVNEMLPYFAEFLGTMILILLGDGVVANVNLNSLVIRKYLLLLV